MTHPTINAAVLIRNLCSVALLLYIGSAAAVDFPQYPNSVKFIEEESLPIEMIKMECTAINVESNYSSCISNTMNQWADYRRAVKEYPDIAAQCYEILKELDDYMLINKCIHSSVEGNG
ncbi:MAG: hypothetical protein AB8B79_04275 [Granulosicoccus sp.]